MPVFALSNVDAYPALVVTSNKGRCLALNHRQGRRGRSNAGRGRAGLPTAGERGDDITVPKDFAGPADPGTTLIPVSTRGRLSKGPAYVPEE